MGLMNRDKVGAFLRSVVQPAANQRSVCLRPLPDERRSPGCVAGCRRAWKSASTSSALAWPCRQQASGRCGAPGSGRAMLKRRRSPSFRDGLKREFSFSKEMPSILDAASAAGLEVPFSCTSGVCGTCRAKCRGRRGAHGAQLCPGQERGGGRFRADLPVPSPDAQVVLSLR